MDRHNRVAAKGEERLGHTHLLDTQQSADDRRQLCLRLGPRRLIARRHPQLGRGQRTTIQLARRCHRQRVDLGQARWNHVLGQPLDQGRAQLGHLYRLGKDHIAGESGDHRLARVDQLAVGTDTDHDGRPHRRVGGQRRIDLAEFDAQTAQLHLIVAPTGVLGNELPGTVLTPAHHIAGAIHPGPRRTERGGDEPVRSQV